MSTTEYVATLTEKHHRIDEQIRSEMNHPSADMMHVSELKKEKLRLKQQIERLSSN